MLTIKGYQKLLQTEFLGGRYHIQQVTEYDRFYDIQIVNQKGFTCLIGLRRESLGNWNGVPTYQILVNGREIGNEVSVKYISDKVNMVRQIEGILNDYPF
jgi:hypothetical protein